MRRGEENSGDGAARAEVLPGSDTGAAVLVFLIRETGERVPLEVPLDCTVAGLEKAAGVARGELSVEGKQLENDGDSLADLGICMQSVVCEDGVWNWTELERIVREEYRDFSLDRPNEITTLDLDTPQKRNYVSRRSDSDVPQLGEYFARWRSKPQRWSGTLVHALARDGRSGPLRTLLRRGGGRTDTHGRWDIGWGEYCGGVTPCMIAAWWGHTDALRVLVQETEHNKTGLEARAEVDKTDDEGWTACMYAAENGCTDALRLLVSEAKADVDKSDGACIVAARAGQIDALRLLFSEAKANVHKVNKRGRSAVHEAAAHGQNDALRVLVLEGKADVDHADSHGHTACMLACRMAMADTLRVLALECGADVNKAVQQGDGWTVCMQALHPHYYPYNDIACLRVLVLECGVDVEQADNRGTTPCMHAARCGNADALRVLVLKGGADVNKADNNGMTACMHAVHYPLVDEENLGRGGGSCFEALLVLQEAGADMNKRDHTGKTVASHAYEADREQVLRRLPYGCRPALDTVTRDMFGSALGPVPAPELNWGEELEQLEDLERILQAEYGDFYRTYDPRSKEWDYDPLCDTRITLVHALARDGRSGPLRTLLRWGEGRADPGPETWAYTRGLNTLSVAGGWGTPCMFAAEKGHVDCLRVLVLEAGAEVDMADGSGQTACMCAAKEGLADTLRVLARECGADLNKADNNGMTACMHAARHGHADALRVLALECGADVNRLDNNGMTASMHAAHDGHHEALLVLVKEAGADMSKTDHDRV
eukprot:Hpha_TRINITY_DN16436_c0_g1::TRINITY_DN16436_c0_g1_i1::g.164081::m.164081/K21440/ANKRD50; ankyrin repeat domain-containing protein 50